MFNRSWGAMIEVPYWQRDYTGAYKGNNAESDSFNNNSIGDIRLLGMWTGLQEDMSTGFLAGFKVPSGDWHYPLWDRDTQIGTGSTDLLLGGYKTGNSPFTLADRPFGWLSKVYTICRSHFRTITNQAGSWMGRSGLFTTSDRWVR